MISFYPAVQRWHLPVTALDLSLHEMALDGAHGNEGVALWLGCRRDGDARVTHVVILRGPGVMKGPAILMISSSLLNDLADVTAELGVSLVGQIHSHGPLFGTTLSPTDLRYGIRVPFFLSVVAPHFALRPEIQITDCGVHVCEGAGYRRLVAREVRDRVVVTPGSQVPLITVGQEE